MTNINQSLIEQCEESFSEYCRRLDDNRKARMAAIQDKKGRVLEPSQLPVPEERKETFRFYDRLFRGRS